MNRSANLVRRLVESFFTASWAQDVESDARPFIRGLPLELAHALFNLLTNDGKQDWQVAPGRPDVPVVLISAGELRAEGHPGVLSGISNWDYAITIRNSASSFVCIVTPEAALTEQHSMVNTTDPVDFDADPERGLRLGSEPWADILADLERELGFSDAQRGSLRSMLGKTWELATEDGVGHRLAATWELVEAWSCHAESDFPGLVKTAGFPCLGTSRLSVNDLARSFEVLDMIGRAATRNKNYAAFEHELLEGLGNFAEDEGQRLEVAIRAFVSSLKGNISSVTVGAFVADLPRSYAAAARNSGWWEVLTCDAWEVLLKRTASGPLSVAIDIQNRLGESGARNSPAIVRNRVEISVLVSADDPYELELFRSEGRKTPTLLCMDTMPILDAEVPEHSTPLTYTAKLIHPEARKQAKVQVVSLETFSPGIFCIVQGALGHEVQRSRAGGVPALDVQIETTGRKDIQVFAKDGTDEVGFEVVPAEDAERNVGEFGPESASVIWLPVKDGQATIRGLDVDADMVLRVHGRTTGHATGTFLDVAITVSPEDRPTETSPCRTSSLVAVHQGSVTREDRVQIMAPSRALGELEDAYLRGELPLSPLLACWETEEEVGDRQAIDLETGWLGSVEPGIFRPDTQAPPAAFVRAREALLERLRGQRRPLREARFDEETVVEAFKAYLSEYVDWLENQPAAAAWMDLVACYGTTPGHGMDRPTSSTLPHVVLMGPLHPLKVAYHVNSQLLLGDTRQANRCPLAGFLDPHCAPSMMRLQFSTDKQDESTSTIFLNAGSSDPFWTVYWASDEFEKRQQDAVLPRVLERLHLLRPGLNGGFDASLMRQALREVEDLSPARTVFRIGLKGEPHGSSTCARELLNWCAHRAKPDRRYRVLDERQGPAVPSDENLAYVSMDKPGAVQWIDLSSAEGRGREAQAPLDVLLIDDLGTKDWSKMDHRNYASVVGAKGLFRSQTRADATDGQIVQVAFAIDPSKDAYKANDELQAVALLEGPCFANGNSHYRFRPNTGSIVQRLQDSDFVAVTSKDVDPACFIHGAGAAGAVLWDYELPSLSGQSSSAPGYYLIAKPRQSMRTAIKSAVMLLAPEDQTATRITDNLEKEVAVRGMPILRRLGRGGSQARGELGVLLALRALQGTIGDHGRPSALPLHDEGRVNLLVAVDPYWDVFEEVRKKLLRGSTYERPDILVFSIDVGNAERPTCILVTPLEVKFRSNPMSPEELGKALGQASNLGSLLEVLWGHETPTELWKLAGTNLLANCIEHGFRVGASQVAHGLAPDAWAGLQARVVLDILSGDARLEVNSAGRLLAFDNREETKHWRLGQGAEVDTVTVGRSDAIRLLHDRLEGRGELVSCIGELGFSRVPEQAAKPGGAEARRGQDAQPRPGNELDDGAVDRPAIPGSGQREPAVDEEAALGLGAAETGKLPVEDEPGQADDNGDQVVGGKPGTFPLPQVTAEAREKVDLAFEGFVGNEDAVKTLKRGLLFASLEIPPHLAKTYLLSGPPSTGKTELSRRVANALGLPFVGLDGKAVETRDKLFSYIRDKLEEENAKIDEVGQDAGRPVMVYPPFVVLIDEVHLVKKGVQEAMLTLLEASDRQVSLKDQVAVVKSATFIFATTRTSELDAAFKTRCAEVKLKPYTAAEVAEMLTRVVRNKPVFQSLKADIDIFLRVASVGRSVPRIALQILEELEQEILVSSDPGRPIELHLQEVMRTRGVDDQGIGQADLDVLEVLEKQKGPIGQDSMVTLLPTVDKEDIRTEVEPFLRKLGYVELTASGRTITPKGKSYLVARRMSEQG